MGHDIYKNLLTTLVSTASGRSLLKSSSSFSLGLNAVLRDESLVYDLSLVTQLYRQG